MLKRVFISSLFFVLTVFYCQLGISAVPPPMQAEIYENRLGQVKILLASIDHDAEKIRKWLNSYESSYPDLARNLLILLNNRGPLGNPVYLKDIEAEYRRLEGKKAWENIPPPLDNNTIKNAYINVWKIINGNLPGTNGNDLDRIAPPIH